jgi:hypothetical protein
VKGFGVLWLGAAPVGRTRCTKTLKRVRAALGEEMRAGANTVGVMNGSSLGQPPHLPRLQNAKGHNCSQALRLQLRDAVEWHESAESLGDGVAVEPGGLQAAASGAVRGGGGRQLGGVCTSRSRCIRQSGRRGLQGSQRGRHRGVML